MLKTSEFSVTRKLLLLYVIVFIPTSVLDHMTTAIGLGMGFEELNPLTKGASGGFLVFKEIILFVLGASFVSMGARGKAKLLNLASGLDFRKFHKLFFSIKGLGYALLIFIPIGLALGRIVVVINNALLIAFDFGLLSISPTIIVGPNILNSNHVVRLVISFMTIIPGSFLIFITCKQRI